VTAAEHVAQARSLLGGAAALEEELATLSPERYLELAVSGSFPRMNASLRWTVDLAQAHALTALAIAFVAVVEELDE
jgi:hypothetical protein